MEMLTVDKILNKDLLLVIERFLKFVKLVAPFFKHNLLKGPVLRKPIFRCVCPNFETTLIVFPQFLTNWPNFFIKPFLIAFGDSGLFLDFFVYRIDFIFDGKRLFQLNGRDVHISFLIAVINHEFNFFIFFRIGLHDWRWIWRVFFSKFFQDGLQFINNSEYIFRVLLEISVNTVRDVKCDETECINVFFTQFKSSFVNFFVLVIIGIRKILGA